MLMHREKLMEAISGAVDQIAGETSADHALGGARQLLERVADKAAGRLDPILEGLDRALAETAEAAAELQSLSADIDLDVGELESLEERLFSLRAAARKYGVEVDGLAGLREEMAEKLSLIEGRGRPAVAACQDGRACARRLSGGRRGAERSACWRRPRPGCGHCRRAAAPEA